MNDVSNNFNDILIKLDDFNKVKHAACFNK